MIEDDEPNLVKSGKSQKVIVACYPFSIELCRLETEKPWTLEVVDFDFTSRVWDQTPNLTRCPRSREQADLATFCRRSISGLHNFWVAGSNSKLGDKSP